MSSVRVEGVSHSAVAEAMCFEFFHVVKVGRARLANGCGVTPKPLTLRRLFSKIARA